ncbi:MAG: response regulator [Deltaproteobacteria bacterium]|nr:response regulator [Deltaproteobacteria bacterium]
MDKFIWGDSLSRETTHHSDDSREFVNCGISQDTHTDELTTHLAQLIKTNDIFVHDMNNLLASIVAVSDLLLRSKASEPALANGLRTILESARELSGLTDKWQVLMHSDATLGGAPDEYHGVPAQPRLPIKGGKRMNRPGHILLIDDEEVVCAATEEMLKRLHYEVTSRPGGPEGIKFYRENWEQIGLVVLDMMMPEMNGSEVFEELRRINPDVDVVVSSGYSHNETARQLLQSGARGFIQKPFRLSDLFETISEILPAPKPTIQG